jgi:hypothetical protein
MRPDFNTYHRPPVAAAVDVLVAASLVQAEARRQFDCFYPIVNREAEARSLAVIERGIYRMLVRGAAKVEDGVVLFWNPVEGVFQAYDADYNELMLSFMGDFKTRYQHRMQLRAVGN